MKYKGLVAKENKKIVSTKGSCKKMWSRRRDQTKKSEAAAVPSLLFWKNPSHKLIFWRLCCNMEYTFMIVK